MTSTEAMVLEMMEGLDLLLMPATTPPQLISTA
jgi:hypothetical protein